MSDLVTTSGLRAGEGEALWHYAMGEIFVPVTIDRVTEGSGVGGSIRSDSIGRMMVAEVAATGQHIQRTDSHITKADNEYFQIALVAGGVGRVAQDDRQAELRTGDLVVYETIRPFEWHFDDAWDVWVFSLPLGSVRLTESERRLSTAHRLDGSAGITGVVSRFLLDLACNSEHMKTEQSEQVLAQASDLVVTLLSGSFEERDAVRGCIQRSLMAGIKDYINQRLTDAALGPSEIASAVNISDALSAQALRSGAPHSFAVRQGAAARAVAARSSRSAFRRPIHLNDRIRVRVRRPQRLQPRLQGCVRRQPKRNALCSERETAPLSFGNCRARHTDQPHVATR